MTKVIPPSAPNDDGTMTVDPIHQFQINNIVPIVTIGGHEIAFTNSALFMLIAVVLIVGAA